MGNVWQEKYTCTITIYVHVCNERSTICHTECTLKETNPKLLVGLVGTDGLGAELLHGSGARCELLDCAWFW